MAAATEGNPSMVTIIDYTGTVFFHTAVDLVNTNRMKNEGGVPMKLISEQAAD